MRRALPLSPLTLAAFALGLGVVLRIAWVGEDAHIVFRSVEQLWAGHGPVWNPHERVQTFPSPLWFLLLAAARAFTGDLYLAALVLGLGAWTATLVVLRRVAGTPGRFLLAVLALSAANAVADFATSGLETSLLFLLLVLFARAWQGTGAGSDADRDRAVLRMAACAGLVLVTRLDHVFLVAPPLVAAAWDRRRRGGRLAPVLLAALGPAAAWAVFSVVYYGFPLPNTAYAKLGAGVPAQVLVRQGVRYLFHTAGWDPVVIAVLAAWVAWGVRRRRAWPWLAGLVLQAVYVVRAGGDFMQGRFLAATFVAAVAVGVAWAGPGLVRRRALWAGLVIYALAFPHTPLNVDPGYAAFVVRLGVADEREAYADALSLRCYAEARRDGTPFPDMAWRREGEALRADPPPVAVAPNVGVLGYAAGTEPVIVDPMALTDPFLARRPCLPGWRIGHFARAIPAAYLAGFEPGAAADWDDPGAASLAADIAVITRGPLWSRDRWAAILRRNRP